MRLYGTLPSLGTALRSRYLRRSEQRVQAHSEAREGVHTALLPIDNTDSRAAFECSLPYRPDGIRGRAARCDHVLDQDDAFTRLERAFEPVGGAVLLRLAPDDQERKTRSERR